MTIISNEKSVVSSCEELSSRGSATGPFAAAGPPREGDRRAGAGHGRESRFVMDLLPLMMLTVCQQVKSVRIERVVDVSTRRIQLQRKVGVGLSVKAFQGQPAAAALATSACASRSS